MLVHCETCNAKVDGGHVGSFVYVDDDVGPSQVSLLRCPQCSWAILVEQDYLYSRGEHTEWDVPRTLYPADKSSLSFRVPLPVRQAFREATLAFRAGAFTAAAVMARLCVEQLAIDRGVKAKNLNKQIQELQMAGVIGGDLALWADRLRLLGNKAAHGPPGAVTKEDASDLLAFAEALVDYVYVYRLRFEEFERRHSKAPET